jgi:hypothetical protein
MRDDAHQQRVEYRRQQVLCPGFFIQSIKGDWRARITSYGPHRPGMPPTDLAYSLKASFSFLQGVVVLRLDAKWVCRKPIRLFATQRMPAESNVPKE